MRKAISNLIEAVRALHLTIIDDAGARDVESGVDEVTFKSGLIDLYDALQDVDADGALSLEAGDPEKLEAALQATFRWIRMQGLSVDEPAALVAEAMGAKVEKKKARYDILPSFAPAHTRKKGAWKPRLIYPADSVRRMRSIEDHRAPAGDMGQVLLKMGDAAPVDVSVGAKR